jgi:serine/threonine protein kinase
VNEAGGPDARADSGADDVPDPRLGTRVDRYTLVRLVGKGGMGAVYEAHHARLARRAAIKFLLPELAARPEILRRFENEAMAAGGLEHANLVAVIDLGRATDGAPYLVMEFLDGEDCAQLLRRAGPLPVPRAANIVLQACHGVAVAHAAGIIHRDLKPENLFLIDAGDGSDQVKVLDFGIAKLRPTVGEMGTGTGLTFGTTYYMSPEQARGAAELDARTDVWSLGVVLYELLGGQKPFRGEQPLNVVHQILTAEAPALETVRPGLPPGLVAVVRRALQKEAERRFPTVQAFAAALAPFAGRAPSSRELPARDATHTMPTPATAANVASARPRRARRLVGTAVALAAAVVTTALVLLRDKPSPAPPSAPAAPAAVVAAPAPPPPAAVVAAPAPLVPPAAPKVSDPSGQSEQPAPSTVARALPARRRALERAGRAPAPAPAAPAGTPSSDQKKPAPPALKLDPNPY